MRSLRLRRLHHGLNVSQRERLRDEAAALLPSAPDIVFATRYDASEALAGAAECNSIN